MHLKAVPMVKFRFCLDLLKVKVVCVGKAIEQLRED